MSLPPATRRRLLAAGGLATLAAAGAGLAWWRRQADEPAQAAARELLGSSFVCTDGTPLPLAGLAGRPALLNFWATWCPPCVRELPELDRFAREATDWQVLGIALDQPQAVQRFLAATPVGFPVVVAPLDTLALVQRLGNTGGGLPFSLLLDGAGRIQRRKLGATTRDELQGWRAALA